MEAVSLTLMQEPAARTGTAAFRALFDAHHDFVWRSLVHLGVSTAHVDDAVQEVFLVVHRRLGDYDPATPMRGWLWGIARHVAHNARRGDAREARKRARVAELPPPTAAHDASASDRELVLAALAQLDDPLREVLLLCDVEGFSAPELGMALGLSPNTISSRLRIARERFARAVTDLTGEGATS